MLQSSGIYSQVRVGEVVRHFAGFYPHPRGVDEVIELVGLGEKRDERARQRLVSRFDLDLTGLYSARNSTTTPQTLEHEV